jgi:hypothetical protein
MRRAIASRGASDNLVGTPADGVTDLSFAWIAHALRMNDRGHAAGVDRHFCRLILTELTRSSVSMRSHSHRARRRRRREIACVHRRSRALPAPPAAADLRLQMVRHRGPDHGAH